MIYRLNLSTHWRIYSIFFVAQLKFVSFESNFYQRFRFNHFDSMFVENDIQRVKFYEIDFLINKREFARREFKYLIRWKEYDFEYDEWRNISKLKNVMNLIKNYEQIIIEIIFLFDRFINTYTSSRFVASFIRRLKLFLTSQKIVVVVVSITTSILSNQRFVVVISFRKTLLNKFDRFISLVIINSIALIFVSNALIRRLNKLKKQK